MSITAEEDIVRVRRMIDESDKLRVESDKFRAEIFKLTAEGNKFNRERWIMPFATGISLAASVSAFITAYFRH